MAKIWIEQSVVEKLMEIVDNEFSASRERRPGYDEVEAYWAAKDAIDAAKAHPAAPEKPAPIRWQEYPWLPEGYEGPQKGMRWLYISPYYSLRESSKAPALETNNLSQGWAEGGDVYLRGRVYGPGVFDWRTTLREILP